MYNLIFVVSQTFMGQYATLDLCNKAMRDIFAKQIMPYPELVEKDKRHEYEKAIDLRVKWQTEYTCVRVK